ncbi:MAG: pyridoxal-phosphate dependent enzyme [Chloroflexota bacterium]
MDRVPRDVRPYDPGWLINPDRIFAAAASIDPVFLNTPVARRSELDDAVGARVVAKVETLNPIKCFKGRGTDHYVRSLPSTARRLVTASAGNFGQALAYCTRGSGIAVTVFASEAASPVKMAAIRRFGAQVRLVGSDFDEAKAAAREHAHLTGDIFAEDSAEASYAEGAGTIALELAAQAPDLDLVLVPLGNGALAAGIGAWMRHASPGTAVIGVVADGAAAMKLSFEQRTAVETATARTVADGIAIRVPVAFGLASCLQTLTAVVSVSDDAILAAVRLIYETLGLVVEPSAAVGLAALSTHTQFRGARVGTIMCGANVTPAQHRQWLRP